MQELYIQHDSGEMSIFLDAFFPTSKTRFNKLLRIIDLDSNRIVLKNELATHFHRRISDCENIILEYGKIYLDNMQKKAATQRLVDSGKYPNGLPLSEEELKQAKKDLRDYKRVVKGALSITKNCTKEKDQFLKLLDCL